MTPPTPPPTQRELAMVAADAIGARLPHGWELSRADQTPVGLSRADITIRIRSPDGATSDILVHAKNALEARDISTVKRGMAELPSDATSPGTLLIAARYLSARVRERLEKEGIAYADATGNLFMAIPRPAMFIRDVGATRDPWRGPGRPRGTFKGTIAARVVRALVDFSPPMTVPELIRCSGVSTGAGYRVVEFLEREDLVNRDSRAPITKVEWRTILERWAEDYEQSFADDAVRMLSPRGIKPLLNELSSLSGGARYVLTGSAAAAYFEEYAQARSALVYADRPEELAELLELRPVETGANVLLVPPRDDVVYMRASKRDGLCIAAPSQIAADLLNGPGRSPSEAHALLDWMQGNEPTWRCRPGDPHPEGPA